MTLIPSDLSTSTGRGTNTADNHLNWRLSDFLYDLPVELIAQAPLANRSDSRLMLVDGKNLKHQSVRDLPQILQAGDHLVFNNTRVIPARVFGHKATGGKLELMLERVAADGRVLAKIRASKSPRPGSIIVLRSSDPAPDSAPCTGRARPAVSIEALITGRQDDLFELEAVNRSQDDLALFIEKYGDIPLPPYIERKPDSSDQERYQTVFAENPGAVAAPTAGLHFDDALFDALAEAGISHSFITLHVGAGTFQPVRVENPDEHIMHAERVSVAMDTIQAIAEARIRGGRIIAVGTTSVRALESAANASGQLEPYSGETRLFLRPGAHFNVVDGIFTNFHLPESTLLMLIAAYSGLENTMQAYRAAVEQRYRFFSYGDAMLVWPQPGVRR